MPRTTGRKATWKGSHQSFTLDTNGQLINAAGFRNIIAAYRNGVPVQLKDVAHVFDGSQSPRAGGWFDGKRTELLLIQREPGANTIAVVDRIKAMMPGLVAAIPPSVHVDLVSDRSLNIRASVQDVELTLAITVGLVILVIFLFLRHAWATIIPSITVPLALVATAGVMYVLGYNLDNISLMALTISVGFVVDDAIVMIENIVRYIEQGEKPFAAAIKGAGQIGFTIISITFSLIAVFIPLLFMGGIIGRLFREFAVTVSVAVVASAFVSLTLTPMMCSRFLRHEDESEKNRFNRAAEALLRRRAARLRPRAELGVPPPAADAGADAGADRADRRAVRARSPRASSRSRTPASSSARRRPARTSPSAPWRRWNAAVGDHPEGSGGVRGGRLRRRHRLQSQREHRAHVHPAEAGGPARRRRRPVIRRLKPQVAQVQGVQLLHAGRPGRDHRHAPDPGAVPVHADRYRRRRN